MIIIAYEIDNDRVPDTPVICLDEQGENENQLQGAIIHKGKNNASNSCVKGHKKHVLKNPYLKRVF
jgi:hypothetical protein